jgi:hypothetical protein
MQLVLPWYCNSPSAFSKRGCSLLKQPNVGSIQFIHDLILHFPPQRNASKEKKKKAEVTESRLPSEPADQRSIDLHTATGKSVVWVPVYAADWGTTFRSSFLARKTAHQFTARQFQFPNFQIAAVLFVRM